MSYRQHWVEASGVLVQTGTSELIADELGGEDEDTGDDEHIVLNDMGNLEAFVLTGTADDLIEVAGRMLTQAMAIKYGHNEAPHQVCLQLGTAKIALRVPDDWTLVFDANGRSYAGIRMPDDDIDLCVVTWDGDPNENTTTYPRGNKVDGEGIEYWGDEREPLYRKCAHCHLFVEEQDADEVAMGHARYIHHTRGDDADEAVESTHEAEAEPGPGAPLTWWKTYGPPAMRSRFIDDETVDVLGGDLPRGRCDTCGAACDAITGKCMREPEAHETAIS